MKLLPAHLVAPTAGHGTTHARDHAQHGTTARRGPRRPRTTSQHAVTSRPATGIEWEDDMVEVNRMTTPANMRWKLLDRDHRRREPRDRLAVPGRRPGEDPAGQRDGLRPPDAPPVPHPRRRPLPDPEPRRAPSSRTWSGRTRCWSAPGETVDILLDVTNPGLWMAHCHIAEHHESGMMFNFHVTP